MYLESRTGRYIIPIFNLKKFIFFQSNKIRDATDIVYLSSEFVTNLFSIKMLRCTSKMFSVLLHNSRFFRTVYYNPSNHILIP